VPLSLCRFSWSDVFHFQKSLKRVGGLGPEYPKEQIAIVKGSQHRFYILVGIYISSTAKIEAVDNKAYDADEVHIPSGPHEVLITIEKITIVGGDLSGSDRGVRLLDFKFDAEAGHTYEVHIPLYWRENSIIKIIDEATDEIVGSQVVN
jgi:hypothetical protein